MSPRPHILNFSKSSTEIELAGRSLDFLPSMHINIVSQLVVVHCHLLLPSALQTAMRVSDFLASNWKSLWIVNVLILKSLPSLQFMSTISILFLSAAFTFVPICIALAIDIVGIIIHRQAVNSGQRCSNLKPTIRRRCKGGICWHEISENDICLDTLQIVIVEETHSSS